MEVLVPLFFYELMADDDFSCALPAEAF